MGPLGFGETYLATIVSKGPLTHYFRHTFNVDDPAAVTAMVGEIMYDDGVVVYLNGLEIGRDAMPSGTITAGTLSTGHEIGNAYETYDWAHHIDLLVAGTNTIAVEVHQVSAGSSDLTFDLALTIETSDAPPPLGAGAWFYWDNGGDLGTSWRTLEGPTTGWDAGDGPLGFGEAYIVTSTSRGVLTTYFRREFTVDDPARVSEFLGEVMYDDGFVAYLNGVEIQRAAMAGGAVSASTLSSGHEANNTYTSYDWSASKDLLVAGSNVLAFEVHQKSATSSDLVFDARLTIETSDAPPPQGEGAWFYWDNGGDLGTSWRALEGPATGWDAGDGPLGFGEAYIVTSTSRGVLTTYFRREFTVDDPGRVSEILCEVMYDDGFVAYLNGVEIQRAAMASGAVSASTLSSGHEANNAYTSYDWSASKDLLVAGSNVLALEVHQKSATSSDLVFDARLTLEISEPPPEPLPYQGVDRGEYWVYWACSHTPSADWATNGFGSSCWSSGRAPLGYGETYLAAALERGPIAHYFYNDFLVDNPTSVTSMVTEVMYDDGFVAYLNGVEIARRSVPSGTVTPTTLATGHEASNAYVAIDLSAHRHLLKPSFNRLAVEVHQSSTTSSDLVIDMALVLYGSGEPAPPETGEDVPRGATWRYWDQGAPGSFASDGYDDAHWDTGPGPIGFGESYVTTTSDRGEMTTYFRRWFTVDDPSVKTRMIAELMYDDGAVVYLNGREIQRLSMTDDPWIDHDTPAIWHEAQDRYETYDWSQFAGLLKPGPNLLAVEIHQDDAGSSDLVFDLSLQLDTPAACAVAGAGPADAPPSNSGLADVWVGPSTVYAVGGSYLGRRSETGGWCWSRPIPDASFGSMWGAGDDDVWLAGASGVVGHYDGDSFTVVDVGTTQGLSGISGTGPDDIWIVGAEGTVRHFDGTSWTAHDLPPDQALMDVWSLAPDQVWISGREPAPYPGNSDYDGDSGVIYQFDPATGAWTLVHKNTMYYGGADFMALHGTSASNIWAVGSDHPAGAACSISGLTRWDNTSWSGVAGSPVECASFLAISAGGPGAEDGAWLGGHFDEGYDHRGYGMYRYTGGAWQEVPAPEVVSGIDYRDDRLYAVGWSTFGGQTVIRWDGSQFIEEW